MDAVTVRAVRRAMVASIFGGTVVAGLVDRPRAERCIADQRVQPGDLDGHEHDQHLQQHAKQKGDPAAPSECATTAHGLRGCLSELLPNEPGDRAILERVVGHFPVITVLQNAEIAQLAQVMRGRRYGEAEHVRHVAYAQLAAETKRVQHLQPVLVRQGSKAQPGLLHACVRGHVRTQLRHELALEARGDAAGVSTLILTHVRMMSANAAAVKHAFARAQPAVWRGRALAAPRSSCSAAAVYTWFRSLLPSPCGHSERGWCTWERPYSRRR